MSPAPEFWRMSAVELAGLVRTGESKAEEITRSALSRLAAVNPSINAVVQEFPEEALAAARAVDDKVANGEDPGVLGGVPVTVKVNVDQAGHATTNGLKIQRDLVADTDNPVVGNLRKAGAIIVGRTNTPAFSLRWFTRNTLHGHTLNPRDPRLTPGGSSGGAAAAVATGICAIGHGTDIAGSIRYPAYACGVQGLRPSFGRVPAVNFTAPDRHIGGQLMAVSGPIARTVGDLRLALQAMSAPDLRDPWWTPAPSGPAGSDKSAALCVTPDGMVVGAAVEEALRAAATRLEGAGWQVTEVPCPPLRKPAEVQAVLWLAEFRRGGAKALDEEKDPDASFVYAQMAALCPDFGVDEVLDALQQRAALTRQWQQFLARYPILLCPVSAELPFPDQLDVESEQAFRRVMDAQLTQVGLPLMGLPALSVSTGLIGRTPVGVQLVAGRFNEAVLLEAGEEIEAGGALPAAIDPWEGDPG